VNCLPIIKNLIPMKMFSKWFGKKKLEQPADLSGLKTDMHSHLVPGIDDGVPDLETAVGLIEKMKRLGYSKLISTPHIMVDIYRNNPAIIQEGFEKVKEAVAARGIDIELQVAAEYQFDEGFTLLLKKGELMTFGQNHVLVELPYYTPPQNMGELLFDMQVAGYKVILAHPERYTYWHKDFSKLEDLKHRDVLFQLNTISLSGYYSAPTKKISEKLIDAGMIDFLGSDLHNFNYFGLLKEALYEPYLEKLLASGNLKNHLL
jgi:protein-tyrosine phosphatase